MSYVDKLERFCRLAVSGKLSKERDQYGVDADFGQDVEPKIRKWLDIPEHLREGYPVTNPQYRKICSILQKYEKKKEAKPEPTVKKRTGSARESVKQTLRNLVSEVGSPVLKEDIVKRLDGVYCATTVRTEVSNCNTLGHILPVWKEGERRGGHRVMRYWMPDMEIPVGYIPYHYTYAAVAEAVAPPPEPKVKQKAPEPEVKPRPKRKKTWRIQLLRDCQRLNEEAAAHEAKAKEIRTRVDVMMGMVLSASV